jgi:hypothetical protein
MVVGLWPLVAAAQPQLIYLELLQPTREPIPPNCSYWHELYPNFCRQLHQNGYDDADGSGDMSPCDDILLDNDHYHIEWVGPTYFLSAIGGPPPGYWEPVEWPWPTGNPVCQMWQQIHPDFGLQLHVDEWEDGDQSGDVTVCDNIMMGGIWYHVDEVAVNIRVTPGPVPNELRTWGAIKLLY